MARSWLYPLLTVQRSLLAPRIMTQSTVLWAPPTRTVAKSIGCQVAPSLLSSRRPPKSRDWPPTLLGITITVSVVGEYALPIGPAPIMMGYGSALFALAARATS